MTKQSKKIQACLEYSQGSRDAREGRLTTRMLAEELISRMYFEKEEEQKAFAVASSFVKKYCTKVEKGLMEPRIPHHYKLKFEYFA